LGPTNSTDSVERTGEAMQNLGGDQIWICPVVKDVRNDSNPEFARISVEGQAVECDFRSRNGEGQQLKTALPDEIDLSGSVRLIRFGVDNPNITVGVTGGYYFFRCEVPSQGKVFSYVVTEEGGGP
jgi:hypothetical protein